jgi:hypothetical protein
LLALAFSAAQLLIFGPHLAAPQMGSFFPAPLDQRPALL